MNGCRFRFVVATCLTLSCLCLSAQAATKDKLHESLQVRLDNDATPVKAWIFFTDKGITDPAKLDAAVRHTKTTYNARAAWRRSVRGTINNRNGLQFNEADLPVHQDYVNGIEATGAQIHITSRWLNAASAWVTKDQAEEIAKLPFVKKLQPVAQARKRKPVESSESESGIPSYVTRGGLDYGDATAQLQQMNLIALHEAGYTGQGVVIGVLDSGFKRTHEAFTNPLHPINVLAEWDFVDGDGNTSYQTGDPSSQHNHGTQVLSTIGAYMPGSLIGGAFDASFVLAKTEDTTDEYPAEEDNYVAGLEFIEEHGADMGTASLGYIDWYTQADMDGVTCVTTIAMNAANNRGLHFCSAAGNEYHDSDPSTSSIIAPSDAFKVITCGGVTSSGSISSFSSDGPTADGRVKPEILARGSSASTVSPSNDTYYTTADGTSFATPLVACSVACLIQARPHWTVDQMREHLFETATDFVENGTYDPLYVRGYGIVDAYAAYSSCDTAGSIILDRPKYACDGIVEIIVSDCDLNTDDTTVETVVVHVASGQLPTGINLTLTETTPDSAEMLGTVQLSTDGAAGTLLVAPGGAVVVTYIDVDDGQGNFNVTVTKSATVDCTNPVISNVQLLDIQPRSAEIGFETDEPTRGTIHFGTDCNNLDRSVSGVGYSTSPTVLVSGLASDTTYFYAVEAEDEAGNTATRDNNGLCWQFTTPEIPDYFTEQFTDGIDLEGFTLTFVPNGSIDQYSMCIEPISVFPVDPAGGTTLTVDDEDSIPITISGNSVSLYGETYSTIYLCSNGYLNLASSGTDYTETVEEHFSQPRISMLWDDLDPDEGGTVSWKQLEDRIVITFEDIREYNGGADTSSSFQAELHFDGTLVLSYLEIGVSDALIGISAGDGLSPDFYPSDFSAYPGCGPRPPLAAPVDVQTSVNQATTITLQATDDGLPNPPAALTYSIQSLPSNGTLDDNGVAIKQLPYLLSSDQVRFRPERNYQGMDSFTFTANDGGVFPEGGDSNTAAVSITIGGPQTIYSFPMNENPGWTTTGNWEFGVPTGNGTHNLDPTSGYTGTNVYGYNLQGDYENNMDVETLTTGVLNLVNASETKLHFQRWLGVESASYDHAKLEIYNGTWNTIWNHSGSSVSDSAWQEMVYDISQWADGHSNVRLRWSMGITDNGVTYPGWNIDDVQIIGLVAIDIPADGDMDMDGDVDLRDFAAFQECFGSLDDSCLAVFDFSGDDAITLDDFVKMETLITGP